jgi:hypothetical protein
VLAISCVDGGEAELGPDAGLGSLEALADNLVGYWKLDEASGTTASDSSGRGNHGTISGAGFVADGRIGGARSIGGSNSAISVPLSGENFTRGTIALWYRPNYSTSSTAGIDHPIITIGPDAWSAGKIGIFNNREWDDLRVAHDRAGTDLTSQTVLPANTWVHIAYTWDAAAGTKALYLDGKLATSAKVAAWTPATPPPSLAYLGASRSHVSTRGADGRLDDVRFYSRPLPAAEVSELFHWRPDAGGTTPPPVPGSATVVGKDARGFATINGQSRFIKLIYDATDNGASYASVTVPSRHFENYSWDVLLNYFLGTNDNAIKAAAALRPYGIYTVAIGNAFTVSPIDPASNLQLIRDPGFRTRWASTPGAVGAYLADEPADSVLSNVMTWQGTYKSAMPKLATITILLQKGFGQSQNWSSRNTGDWFGIDPYPFQGLESYPLKSSPQSGAASSYGWSLDYIAEGAANHVKWARQYGKTAIVINQLFRGFWGSERMPNATELWAQAIMPIVEGAHGVGWWAFGSTYDGALHSSAVPAAERTSVEATLGQITRTLASLNSVLVSAPQPTKLVLNSTRHASGDPKQWRIEALTSYLTLWPPGYDKPFYQLYADMSQWWQPELTALKAGDTSRSYMLDQASYVRTRVFETADGTAYVFAYNHRPSHYASVGFRWYRSISRVEDLTTGQVFAIGSDGTSWSAGFGGSSTKRQAGLRTARIFKLTR